MIPKVTGSGAGLDSSSHNVSWSHSNRRWLYFLLNKGKSLSWDIQRIQHSCVLFASSVFSGVVSHVYKHFPDIPRNASSCISLLPVNEMAQDWWDGLSPTVFFQALFYSLVFNQCVHGLKESQKFSRESLFLRRHSFWFLLLWCLCTDFTLRWIFSVTFSFSAWSLRQAETSLKGVNERNPFVLKGIRSMFVLSSNQSFGFSTTYLFP